MKVTDWLTAGVVFDAVRVSWVAPTLIGTTSTDAGTVDSATSPDGRYLYVQTGAAGIVDEFSVGNAGSLVEIGSVTVPGAAGGQGIATILEAVDA